MMNKNGNIEIEKTIASKELINLDWMRIVLDDVSIKDELEAKRLVLHHIGASAVLATTSEEEEKVLLVQQFRYPAQKALYEIPAGKLDNFGDDFELTARRELAEETPYTAKNFKLISKFFVAPGYSDEYMHIFHATGLEKNSVLELDDDEFIAIHFFTKKEINTMLVSGEIEDAKTIIALQYWLYGHSDHEQ